LSAGHSHEKEKSAMPSSFIKLPEGPLIYVDPDSDLDYIISAWIEGATFNGNPTFSITPAAPGSVYNISLNAGPVTIDGVTYVANTLVTFWMKLLTVNVDYTVTCHATFSGARVDDRSFTAKCRNR
jgi:hypothetical protein